MSSHSTLLSLPPWVDIQDPSDPRLVGDVGETELPEHLQVLSSYAVHITGLPANAEDFSLIAGLCCGSHDEQDAFALAIVSFPGRTKLLRDAIILYPGEAAAAVAIDLYDRITWNDASSGRDCYLTLQRANLGLLEQGRIMRALRMLGIDILSPPNVNAARRTRKEYGVKKSQSMNAIRAWLQRRRRFLAVPPRPGELLVPALMYEGTKFLGLAQEKDLKIEVYVRAPVLEDAKITLRQTLFRTRDKTGRGFPRAPMKRFYDEVGIKQEERM